MKVVLEMLGGGVFFAILYKLRKSGCILKKKANSCECSLKADIDGDGKTDIKISVSDLDTPTSSEEIVGVHAPSGAHRSSESKI